VKVILAVVAPVAVATTAVGAPGTLGGQVLVLLPKPALARFGVVNVVPQYP